MQVTGVKHNLHKGYYTREDAERAYAEFFAPNQIQNVPHNVHQNVAQYVHHNVPQNVPPFVDVHVPQYVCQPVAAQGGDGWVKDFIIIGLLMCIVYLLLP